MCAITLKSALDALISRSAMSRTTSVLVASASDRAWNAGRSRLSLEEPSVSNSVVRASGVLCVESIRSRIRIPSALSGSAFARRTA